MKKQIDLGTLVNAEVYYTSIEEEGKKKSKTLQAPSAVNEDAPQALFSLPGNPSEETRGLEGVMAAGPKVYKKAKPGFKRLDPNAKYDRICVQLANLRNSSRYTRANIYVSLKEDNEQKFSVFLTGAITNAKSELYRGCKGSQSVKHIIDALFDRYPDILVGRLRYKSITGYITDFHKKNTKSALIGVYKNSNNDYVAVLVLYYEFIEIPLTHPLSDNQNGMYVVQGLHEEFGEFDDEEGL